MVSPFNFHHVEADILMNLGGEKYLILGLPNGIPVVRIHDCSYTDKEGKYSRFATFDFQQWCDFATSAASILPSIRTLRDDECVQNAGRGNYAGSTSNYENESFKSTRPSTDIKFHLGKNLHVVGKPHSKYLHVRRYFLSEENALDRSLHHTDFELTPTKQGVVLSFEEWAKLLSFIPLVRTIMFPGNPFHSCFSKHLTEETLINECEHCNPNGYMFWVRNRDELQSQNRKLKKEEKGKEHSNIVIDKGILNNDEPGEKTMCSNVNSRTQVDPRLISLNKAKDHSYSDKENESNYWSSLKKKKKGTKSKKRGNELISCDTEIDDCTIVNTSTHKKKEQEQEGEDEEEEQDAQQMYVDTE